MIKLRSKGNTYKSKRQEISELQTEYTNLKRTEEILKQKFDQVKDNLVISMTNEMLVNIQIAKEFFI